MSNRIDELSLQDVPGVGHVSDFLNKRKGKNQAINLSRMLMKQYMIFLGRHKGMRANIASLKTFIDNNIQDPERYLNVIDNFASSIVSSDVPQQVQKPVQPKPTRGPSPGNMGGATVIPPKNPSRNGSGGVTRQTPPTGQKSSTASSTPQNGSNQSSDLNRQQAAERLNKELLNPAMFRQNMKDLETIVQDAVKKGGSDKQKVMTYLNDLRNNEELRQQNPKLVQAISPKSNVVNGKTATGQARREPMLNRQQSENYIRLIDFASFLVEYDLREKYAFQGAMQFLYEISSDSPSFVPPGTVHSGWRQHPQPEPYGMDDDDEENENDAARDSFMNQPLPRSSVLKLLNKVAIDMIDSGDYYFDPKEVHGKNKGISYGGGHGGRSNHKPDSWDGLSKPNFNLENIPRKMEMIANTRDFKKNHPNGISRREMSIIQKAIATGKNSAGKINRFAKDYGVPLSDAAKEALYDSFSTNV